MVRGDADPKVGKPLPRCARGDRDLVAEPLEPAGTEDAGGRVADHLAAGWVEPAAGLLSGDAPGAVPSSPGSDTVAFAARVADVERWLGRVARKVAWGSDGRRATARIELDVEGLAGGVLVVHADAQGLDIELDLPPGQPSGLWRDRLRQRLETRGVTVRRFEVT